MIQEPLKMLLHITRCLEIYKKIMVTLGNGSSKLSYLMMDMLTKPLINIKDPNVMFVLGNHYVLLQRVTLLPVLFMIKIMIC